MLDLGSHSTLPSGREKQKMGGGLLILAVEERPCKLTVTFVSALGGPGSLAGSLLEGLQPQQQLAFHQARHIPSLGL